MEHKLIENMNKQKDNVAYIKYPHYFIHTAQKNIVYVMVKPSLI